MPKRGDGSVASVHAPGWLARWKARRGIRHPPGKVAFGYQSWREVGTLSKRELNHGGAIFGAPGSGKTTTLGVLIQGHANIGPCIVLDVKGSPKLRAQVAAQPGGLVWTIGGRLMLDLLDPDPTILADQIGEAARVAGGAEVYHEAGQRAVQWAGHVLRWRNQAPTLESVEALLRPGSLAKALGGFKASKPRVATWLDELGEMHEAEQSGTQTTLMRVTNLLDSAAGPSLGTGAEAARLEDVVQGKTTLLLSLDSSRYPRLSHVLGGWCLVAMRRACASVPKGASCLMVVDEVGDLGRQAAHLPRLLTTAREQGVGVVVAAHSPSQLEQAIPNLASVIINETAWQMVMRLNDPDDADRLSRLFPLDDRQRMTLGKVADGTPHVTRDHIRALSVGDALTWVAAVDKRQARWGRFRIAMPQTGELPEYEPDAVGYATSTEDEIPSVEVAEDVAEDDEADLRKRVYARIRVVDGWRMWRGNFDKDGYPREWSTKTRRYRPAHRLVCEWERGEAIPKGWTVDHGCSLKDCMDHLEAVPLAENLRRRHARDRGEIPTGHAGMVPSEVGTGTGTVPAPTPVRC